MLLLDTLPLIDFFKAQSETVRQIILESQDNLNLAISTVTISELFYILARERDTEFAVSCIENIRSQFVIISVDEQIAQRAGELKFVYSGKGPKKGMPLADCIIAATALENDTTLVTQDDHFKKIEGLKIKWV